MERVEHSDERSTAHQPPEGGPQAAEVGLHLTRRNWIKIKIKSCSWDQEINNTRTAERRPSLLIRKRPEGFRC